MKMNKFVMFVWQWTRFRKRKAPNRTHKIFLYFKGHCFQKRTVFTNPFLTNTNSIIHNLNQSPNTSPGQIRCCRRRSLSPAMKSLTSTSALLLSTSPPSLRSSLLPTLRPLLYRARLRNKLNLVINLITTCSNLILT